MYLARTVDDASHPTAHPTMAVIAFSYINLNAIFNIYS